MFNVINVRIWEYEVACAAYACNNTVRLKYDEHSTTGKYTIIITIIIIMIIIIIRNPKKTRLHGIFIRRTDTHKEQILHKLFARQTRAPVLISIIAKAFETSRSQVW